MRKAVRAVLKVVRAVLKVVRAVLKVVRTVLIVVDSQDAHNSSQERVIPARRNIEQTILLCHIHSPVFLADLLVDVSTENFNRI